MLTGILLDITMLLGISMDEIEVVESSTEIVFEIEDVIVALEEFVESL